MSNSVRPHRRQPTRFPRPWDSPGKNTGVGCHFLLQCMKVKSQSEVSQSCWLLATPWTAAYQAPPSMGFSRQEHWSGVPSPSPPMADMANQSLSQIALEHGLFNTELPTANAHWNEGHSGWNLFANTFLGIYNLELEFCTKNRPGHTHTNNQPTNQTTTTTKQKEGERKGKKKA